jgi:membrane-bound acyltransferase YfiQ involved in biofilm formation
MWRWSAIPMALMAYIIVRQSLPVYLTGGTPIEIIVLAYAPLFAAIIILGVVVLAPMG